VSDDENAGNQAQYEAGMPPRCEQHHDREGHLAVDLPSINVRRYLCDECSEELAKALASSPRPTRIPGDMNDERNWTPDWTMHGEVAYFRGVPEANPNRTGDPTYAERRK